MQTFFLNMYIYAWGLTTGSMEYIRNKKDVTCRTRGIWNNIFWKIIAPHPIKLDCLVLKCTPTIKKLIPHVNLI